MTSIKLHGELGKVVGENWKLAVSSVSEAIHAIETLSKRKLYKFLYDGDKKGIKYKVFLNGELFTPDRKLEATNVETIKNSELCIKKIWNTIDIIPILEGADNNVFAIVLGAILIIAGIALIIFTGGLGSVFGAALIIAGIGIVAAGVANLLSSPPKFDDFREAEQRGGISYLFNGPQNVTREGGPVPVLYGRLIVGSQVISASYDVTHRNAEDNPITA